MNHVNHDRLMYEQITDRHGEEFPKLLLHACCAPCSSACLEKLWQYFDITLFYYNPNIDNEPEYQKRLAEEKRLIDEFNRRIETGDFLPIVTDNTLPSPHRIEIIDGDHDTDMFHSAVRGLENAPEGGERCMVCFALRLDEAAKTAASRGFDFFTTTLTLSPLKNADVLNDIGAAAGEKHGVCWLHSDFKKRDGYKRSIELSREYDLYRQDYCGCSFSKRM
ncbi:MAG: epoxyqueuosine reductase QueH [Lachnospiraceae bacterium]|nr:epoxyqueuosine reductase QueH [Lachnospiraceae bacterium]